MARIITKELALKIAKKLDAQIVKEGAHDIAQVFHEGRLVAQFGIRRGSEKDKGHDHIPRDLHLGPGRARLLGQCPMKREDWIHEMIDQGRIDPPEEDQNDESNDNA